MLHATRRRDGLAVLQRVGVHLVRVRGPQLQQLKALHRDRRVASVRLVDTAETPDIEELVDRFSFFDDWADRYRYIIDLGKKLAPLADEHKVEANRVEGCVSNVWLIETPSDNANVLTFAADSDAHITKGLVALLMLMFSGKPRTLIANTDVRPIFEGIGLDGHLSPSRSNGLYSMVRDIKAMARGESTTH